LNTFIQTFSFPFHKKKYFAENVASNRIDIFDHFKNTKIIGKKNWGKDIYYIYEMLVIFFTFRSVFFTTIQRGPNSTLIKPFEHKTSIFKRVLFTPNKWLTFNTILNHFYYFHISRAQVYHLLKGDFLIKA